MSIKERLGVKKQLVNSIAFVKKGSEIQMNVAENIAIEGKLGDFFSTIIQSIRRYAHQQGIQITIVPARQSNEVVPPTYHKKK